METPVKKRLSKKAKIEIAVALFALLVVVCLVALDLHFEGPITNIVVNRDKIVENLRSHLILGPIIYILLQVAQTVVAPIPGQVVSTVGGYIFGWWGILWTMIGSSIGFFIVFWLARRFGRPLVEKIFKKSAIDKFDFVTGEHAAPILFAIFLIPGLPDDMVCYIAGLTKVPIKTLMVLVILGRFPSIVMNNLIGSGLSENNITVVAIATVISVLILGIIAWKKESIIGFLKELSQKFSD